MEKMPEEMTEIFADEEISEEEVTVDNEEETTDEHGRYPWGTDPIPYILNNRVKQYRRLVRVCIVWTIALLVLTVINILQCNTLSDTMKRNEDLLQTQIDYMNNFEWPETPDPVTVYIKEEVIVEPEEEVTEEETTEEPVPVSQAPTQTYTQSDDPGVLTAYKGVNYNANGNRETYYNLPMGGIVDRAQNEWGIEGEYWVREDGCKMYGDYIIVAANLSVYPRGTIVETSLGQGIVLDTGGFAESNPYQFDIATDW